MSIGEEIRRKREALGMSQDELAKKCGYASRVSISKIESEEREIPKDKIIYFARALNMLPEYLMGFIDEDGIDITDADLAIYSEDKELLAIFERAKKDSDYREKLVKFAELIK